MDEQEWMEVEDGTWVTDPDWSTYHCYIREDNDRPLCGRPIGTLGEFSRLLVQDGGLQCRDCRRVARARGLVVAEDHRQEEIESLLENLSEQEDEIRRLKATYEVVSDEFSAYLRDARENIQDLVGSVDCLANVVEDSSIRGLVRLIHRHLEAGDTSLCSALGTLSLLDEEVESGDD